MTRGDNFVADGWAGAPNPHPHLMPPNNSYSYQKEHLKRSFFHFSTRGLQTDGRTDGRTDGQSLLLSCVSATKNASDLTLDDQVDNKWQLYKRLCPFVHPSVRCSVRWSVVIESKSGKTSVSSTSCRCLRVGLGDLGVDRGRTPLPTRRHRYCDPASLVIYHQTHEKTAQFPYNLFPSDMRAALSRRKSSFKDTDSAIDAKK